MGDLIRRQDAIDEIEHKLAEPEYLHHGEDWYVGMSNAEHVIYYLPPVLPKPKIGRWIKVPGYATPGGDPVWCCSECGKGVHVYGIEHGTYGGDVADGQWVACPNCGAIMEET